MKNSKSSNSSEENKLSILERCDHALYIRARVQPRASSTGISGVTGDALKLRVMSPPVEGEANKAVLKFFSKLLKVPKGSISVVSGLRSRDKRIKVDTEEVEVLAAIIEELL